MKARLTKDFGNKKAGTVIEISGMLFGRLLQEGVIEKYVEPVAPVFPIVTEKIEKPKVIKKKKK
jgi:hypothetical protein